MFKNKTLQIPTPGDPRWPFLAFSLCFNLYALISPGFHRLPTQWIASVATGISLDVALHYFLRDVIILPLSGLLTSLSCVLLCDSPLVWPYVAVSALSIFSKHLLRTPDKARPIFNPSNFGIVSGLLLLSHFMDVVPGRWGGSAWTMALVAILGFLIAIRVKRLYLCLSWLGTFFIIAVLRSLISGWPFITTIAPATGAAFMLVTFFMITDPMSTPSSPSTRILFGITLGIIDGVLRYFQIINSPLYALFILCAFSGTLYAAGNPRKENIFCWDFLELWHSPGNNQGK